MKSQKHDLREDIQINKDPVHEFNIKNILNGTYGRPIKKNRAQRRLEKRKSK